MCIRSRKPIIVAAAVAAFLTVAGDIATADDDILDFVLIGVQRDRETGRVRVRVPFVRVETGPAGTRVRAPFTRFRSRRYSYPYTTAVSDIPPRPKSLGTVHVQLDSKVRVVFPETRVSAQPTKRADRKLPAPPKPDDSPRAELGKSSPEPEPADAAPEVSLEELAPAAPPSPQEVPKKAKPREIAQPAPRSYMIIPLAASDPIPEIRVAIRQAGQKPPQTAQPGPPPPAPENAKDKPDAPEPATSGKTVYDLAPMWHTEVTQVFQPAAGVHVFAFIHPRTQRVVSVQVNLPDGRPRIKLKRHEVEFDYGRHEVEIDFKRDGRVIVDYQN